MQQRALKVLITGANRGIGKGAIETGLSNPLTKSWHYCLTSLNPNDGKEAVEALKRQFKDASLETKPLDLLSKESIDKLVDSLPGKIDILVNNAGVYISDKYDPNANVLLDKRDPKSFKTILGTNWHGTHYLTERMLAKDRINDNGKIVFVSSMASQILNSTKELNPRAWELLSRYKTTLTFEQLDEIVRQYEFEFMLPFMQKFWNPLIYSHTKLFLSIYAYMLGKEKRIQDKNIQVYALCPGACRTDMTKDIPGVNFAWSYLDGGNRVYKLMTIRDKIDPAIQGCFFNENTKVAELDNFVIPK